MYRRLLAAFGPQGWWPADSPFEVLIGAVLTQNTSWRGVESAIANLRARKLLAPAPLLGCRPDELARLIRPAGCPNVKARRLHNLLELVRRRGGIAGMRKLSTPLLRQDLLAVNGIGPETADSVLLYAFNRPVFVIDAYTRRILSRHRLITGRESYDRLRCLLEAALPREYQLYNEYHALLVAVGKRYCRPRPHCANCPLAEPTEPNS